MVKRKRDYMKFGEHARAAGLLVKALGLSLALMAASQSATAAAPAAAPVAEAATATAAPAATPADAAVPAAGGYVPMKPTPGKGMPVDGGIGLQDQYSPLGEYAKWIHNDVLLPIIAAISMFVLVLLLWVMARYNKRANPVASRTSHNSVIEVIWTLVPVLILVGIAIPSIDLLAKQYKPAPASALTIKATGYQWYWTYTYPDNGGFEVTSNMLKEKGDPSLKPGDRFRTDDDGPGHLAADYRMVVPAGEPIRLQITASDVIHAFAVPSLWFKLDAVPGRINEKVLFIKEPGVYFGQCSELCGVRHGYMPITIEALPRDRYNAWVLTQSEGVIDGQPKPAEAPAAAASAAPAPAAPAAPAPAAPASPAPAAPASPAPAAPASPAPAA